MPANNLLPSLIAKMTNFANIPKGDLLFIVQTLNKHLKHDGYRLFVFGSRSQKAPCKTHSDLDIAVEMDSAIPRKTLFKIEEDFEESNLNYQVDLLDLNRISDSFSKSIHHKLVPITQLKQSWAPKTNQYPWASALNRHQTDTSPHPIHWSLPMRPAFRYCTSIPNHKNQP